MAKYLDPKNDMVFKRIFRDHPELFISFLNALIPLEKDVVIKSVEYLPLQWMALYRESEFTIVDVQCKDSQGQQFIVETQLIWNAMPQDYLLYLAERSNNRLLSSNTRPHDLKTIYGFDIINSNIDYEKKCHYSHLRMASVGESDRVHLYTGIDFVIVELKKFKPGMYPERPMFDLWLRFLREMDGTLEKAPEDLLAVAEIREAIGLCEAECYTPEELAAYEKQIETVTLVEKELMKWEAEGAKRITALAMLKTDASVEHISEMTGLSAEEIDGLRKELPANDNIE